MSELNDYQKAAKASIELLFDAANGFRGRVLDAVAVRHVASYVRNLENAVEKLTFTASAQANLLAAYMNEYGDKLANELMEVVDGELVEEETGQPSEESRLDAQVEGEEE